MTTLSATANWDTIQDVFYRKEELYTMSWKTGDLEDYIVGVGKNGGPIAMIRDERRIVALGPGKHTSKPRIQIYTSSGIQLQTLTYDITSPPILLHFTQTNDTEGSGSGSLVVLAENGLYRIYELSGEEYKQYSLSSAMGLEDGSAGGGGGGVNVLGAKAWDGGMVVLTSENNWLEVRGWKGARPASLASSGLTEPPHSWTLIPPDQSTTGHVQILYSTQTTIITLDAIERIDQRIQKGPFTHIRLSPNGRFVALITFTGSLWVVSADFARNLSQVEIAELSAGLGTPEGVEWCGDNALVLSWKGRVVVVGPGGDSLNYDFPSAVYLVGELDGLRIVSSTTCEFIQKIPDSSLAVFSPGSTHPAAILFDALDHFDRKSPKADESIRSIRPELAMAVDTCVEAAGREVEPHWQKRLLRAAQFGRAFMDLYNPSDFVGMAQTLKVLNAVRYYEIGIPITYEQYISTSPSFLINILISRNLHLLALRISQHLGLRPDPVLKHWATAKILRSTTTNTEGGGSDQVVCKAIVDKFEKEGERGVSFADIAKKAWEAGRTKLATMLLDHEPRAAEQVPLLLQMKEDKIALTKAVDSGDTDLVYQVLLHLRSSLSPGDFFHLLDDSISPHLKPAVSLLQVYARQADRSLLRDFYYQDDRRTESACLEMEEAGRAEEVGDRIEHLKLAAKHFSESKDRAFEAKMTEDSIRLLSIQSSYEKELENKYTFAGLSINDFITKLVIEGLNKRAERIRTDYRISDKRFWYIKLKALAKIKDWEALEVFAKSKKSPIGYEPFVTHLLSLNPPQPTHAATYISRCDPKSRTDLYVACGDWGKAAESAKERGDKAKLEQLRRSAPNGIAQREVDEVIRRQGR